MSKKRILILVADVGQGHRSVSEAIIEAIEEQHTEMLEATMVNLFDHEQAPSFMQSGQVEYDWIARDWPKLNDLSHQMSKSRFSGNVVEMAHTIVLYRAVADTIKAQQPDVIISTFPTYQAPVLSYLNLNHSPIPLLTVITDLSGLHPLWFHADVDCCLVPNQVAADLAADHGLSREQIKISGLPVKTALARKAADKRALRADLGWETDRFTVLAVGSQRVKALDRFVHILNHAGFPIQLILVAGGNDELHARLKAETWHVPTRLYNFVEEMPMFMHAADCTLSKAGGLIVTESLAAGLPLLMIQAQVEQEVGNARFVETHEAGDLTEEPLALLETFCHWLTNDGHLYQQRAAKATELGQPQAAYQAADLIAQVARNGRTPREGAGVDQSPLRALFQQFGVNP